MVMTKEERKASKKESDRLYRLKNKEKIKENKKEYYKNNKESKRESDRLYRLKNIEKIKENDKKYNDKNKEKRKEYRETHKEEIKAYMKEYNKTQNGIKTYIKSGWKRYRLKDSDNDNYEKLYNLYLNTNKCDVCKYEFDKSNWKCMDHDHSTGEFRQILCHRCNTRDKWIKVKAAIIIQKYYRKYIRKLK